MTLLPFIITAAIGYLLLDLLTRKTKPLNFALKLFLGTGLGLGLSSHLTFYSYLFFNHLEPKIIIITHFIILATLIILRAGGAKGVPFSHGANGEYEKGPQRQDPPHSYKKYVTHVVVSLLTILITTAVLIQSQLYPKGGWDAWQVWNFKAKFPE